MVEVDFHLELGPHGSDQLTAVSFVGEERLSSPFMLRIEARAKAGIQFDANELLGSEARFILDGLDDGEGGEARGRTFRGIISRTRSNAGANGALSVELTLVPRLWKLGQMHRSRVFQELSVPEIARRILEDWKIPFRLALSASYTRREYCVQYRESDLNFVSRLLEEEGIYYFFEDSGRPGETAMVLADASTAHEPVAGEACLRLDGDTAKLSKQECFEHFGDSNALASTSVVLRDFSYLHPSLDLEVRHQDEDELELYDAPAGLYSDTKAGKQYARVVLEGNRAHAGLCFGTSTCGRLAPGHLFELDGHPRSQLNRRYAVVSIQHRGHYRGHEAAGSPVTNGRCAYGNHITCLDSEAPFRPVRKARRPVLAGPQTAVVVGPRGEEIHTDEHGRVKIRFHWDREGKSDENSSCWVRSAQCWAGAGFGAQFIPRVGQEVVVRFLEGDPDRPLVTGAVYNGEHLTAVELPADKTKSTVRSDSSIGGGGFNELRFEDAAEQEEIFIHAQRDEKVEVNDSKSQSVGANETLSVGNDRSRKVQGEQQLTVRQNDGGAVKGGQTVTVAKDRSTVVGMGHTEAVMGAQSTTVGMSQSLSITAASVVNVGAAAALNVGGGMMVNVAGVMNEAVAGIKASQVGGASVEVVGAARSETVGGKRVASIGGNQTVDVEGSLLVAIGKDSKETTVGKREEKTPKLASFAGKKVMLSADKLSIVVGDKLILSMDGSSLKLAGKTIAMNGSAVKWKGSNISKVAAGAVQPKKVDTKDAEALEKAKGVIRASFLTEDGKPALVGMPIELVCPDGTTKKGKVGPTGKLAVTGQPPGKAKLSFPEIKGRGGQGGGGGSTKVWHDLCAPLSLAHGANDFKIKREAIPIIFVPGFMGSRLRNALSGKMVWDPDDGRFMVDKHAGVWIGPQDKKAILVGEAFDSGYLEPFSHKVHDPVHNAKYFSELPKAIDQGWGGLYWDSYGDILQKLSAADWQHDLVKACFKMPVYAFAYNWTDDVYNLSLQLKDYISEVISQHRADGCQQVILVTHSMGGLVSRAASEIRGARDKILGIVHGVQPVTGSAAAYWRMKAGLERPAGKGLRKSVLNSLSAWSIGTNGKEVTAVLANLPGGLELLPTKHYNDGKPWILFFDQNGNPIDEMALPNENPFKFYEIRGECWSLVDSSLLTPGEKDPVLQQGGWSDYIRVLRMARDFHEGVEGRSGLELKSHPQTHVFWGIGFENPTADVIRYKLAKRTWKRIAGEWVEMGSNVAKDVAVTAPLGWVLPAVGGATVAMSIAKELFKRTDYWQSRGGFKTRIEREGSLYEMVMEPGSGEGDGTVPVFSAKRIEACGDSVTISIPPSTQSKGLSPATDSGALKGVEHQPAFKEYSEVRRFVFDAINRLCLYRMRK